MRTGDYFDEILGAFRKQRLRTFLTAFGIGIGAFAITLMVGLGQGLQSYIEDQFLAFSNDRVVMVFPASARIGERILERITGFGQPAKKLTEEDDELRRIQRGGLWISEEQVEGLKKVEGVESVSPMTWLEIDGVSLVGASEAVEGFYETDFASLYTSPLIGHPSAGRLPEGPGEVALSAQYAQSFELAPEALLGREVDLRVPKLASIARRFNFRDPTQYKDEHETFRAKVVGLAEKSPFSRVVYTSLPLGTEMARYQSQNPEFLSESKIGFQAHVRIADGANAEVVKAKIRSLDLVARSVDDQLGDIRKIFLVVDLVLTSFGLLALLVATLGIANTLLMAITERTREIGVMMALGMTRRTVRRIFALEAATIGLVGGVGGTLLAVGIGLVGNVVITRFVPAAEGLEGYSVFVFPAWLLAGAPVFSSLIGALAGIYPANRAARLDPIQALHHE